MCGYQDEYDFVLRVVGVGLRKKVFQDRDRGQPRNPGQSFRLLVFHDAAQQVDFTIFQADLMLDLALSDHGLADAANAYVRGHRRDVERHLQAKLLLRHALAA